MSISRMRKSYGLAGLDRKDIDANPLVQFQKWFHQAHQPDLPSWLEVNAMTLSTSDGAGGITSRIVLLKGIEEDKFRFFTNYESTKGRQLAAEPRVSLCFFWPHCERQVRIEGIASKTTREVSVEYFHSRPRESQLGAHVSRQSSVIEDAETLRLRLAELEKEFAEREIPCPDNWGGYEVAPSRFEFWQGRPSRLHDRFRHQQTDHGWKIERLSP